MIPAAFHGHTLTGMRVPVLQNEDSSWSIGEWVQYFEYRKYSKCSGCLHCCCCCCGYCLCSGLCNANHRLVYQYEYVQGHCFVSRRERIGTRMRLAWTYYLWNSIIQCTVGRAGRLHARKQGVAWPPHSDIAGCYLQSVVRFRCLLHYYDGVFVWSFTAVCQAYWRIDCLCTSLLVYHPLAMSIRGYLLR